MEIQSVLTGCPFLPIIPAHTDYKQAGTVKLSQGVEGMDGNIIGVPIRPKWPFYILYRKDMSQ